ncbi:MAG: DUF934 domain-containing protein [Burkholderiales bacterium]|nr:DUF934 domain-containing protein [Burkholderiales bacterium]
MASVVRKGRIESERWQRLDEVRLAALCAGAEAPALAAESVVLIPLGLWLVQRARLACLALRSAVLLNAEDDPSPLLPHLGAVSRIAVHFARFADGRGYSLARVLRQRHGYRGELRAIGDVLRDQLFYLGRVGFDAFELRSDQDPHAGLAALADFSASYQGCSDQPAPLFRRRAA